MVPSKAIIDDFLQQRRIAFVGVSRNPREFANLLYRHLRECGYDLVPVNPGASQVEGQVCYPSVSAIPEPVDGALIMVPASRSAEVVRDCRAAGVGRVWLYRGAGPGSASAESIAEARAAGMSLVDGACPFMFVQPVGWFHRCHKAVQQWSGYLKA